MILAELLRLVRSLTESAEGIASARRVSGSFIQLTQEEALRTEVALRAATNALIAEADTKGHRT